MTAFTRNLETRTLDDAEDLWHFLVSIRESCELHKVNVISDGGALLDARLRENVLTDGSSTFDLVIEVA